MGKTLCVQHRDGGSTPTHPLHFQRCQLKDVKEFICEHHYSHTIPAGITDAYILYRHSQCSGAALFGYGAGNPRSFWGFPPCLFRELVRFVLLDDMPKNSESMFLGWCLRSLGQSSPELTAVITFADPAHGHTGTIYKAANFTHLSLKKAHIGHGRGPYSPIPKHKFIYVFPGVRGSGL